VKPAPGG